jgi:hypothetical protein
MGVVNAWQRSLKADQNPHVLVPDYVAQHTQEGYLPEFSTIQAMKTGLVPFIKVKPSTGGRVGVPVESPPASVQALPARGYNIKGDEDRAKDERDPSRSRKKWLIIGGLVLVAYMLGGSK